jgi:hypothetical protein
LFISTLWVCDLLDEEEEEEGEDIIVGEKEIIQTNI